MIAFFTIILMSIKAMAGLELTYNQLTMKDLDQMAKIVSGKIKEANKQSDEGGLMPLKEAVQLVFSRPEKDDNMIDKLLPQIRHEIDKREAWEEVMNDLVDEAVGALKNPKAFNPNVQVTYAIFLKNVITEFKPAASNSGLEQKTLIKIRDAKIKISSEAKNKRFSSVMDSNLSPSKMARIVLEDMSAQKTAPKSK